MGAEGLGVERRFRFGVVMSQPRKNDSWPEGVRTVEALGYQTLLMTDHLDGQLAPGPALGVAAAVAPRLRVGTMVYCNDFRHPLVLAEEAATLDRLSGGRFELGLGAGWDHLDYRRAGLPFDGPGRRIGRLAESVEIVRRCFLGEEFSFKGDHYQITDHTGGPPPTRAGGPPILIGGGGRRLLSVAGALADIVAINPAMTLGSGGATTIFGGSSGAEGTSAKVGWITEAAHRHGNRPELSTSIYAVIFSDDRERAARALARRAGVTTEDVLGSPHALIGTVDQIVASLERRRQRWGISYIVVNRRHRLAFAPVVARLAGC